MSSRLPSLVVGNGRLLVALDSSSTILSACWPCIDSPNQMTECIIIPEPSTSLQTDLDSTEHLPTYGYVEKTNISVGLTREGLDVKDYVVDGHSSDTKEQCDVHVRRIKGPHPNLRLHIVPELDGRPRAQTIYWDAQSEALLAYCRDKWLAISGKKAQIYDYHCGQRHDAHSTSIPWLQNQPSRQRIASGYVDGTIRLRESTDDSHVFFVWGSTRETVLAGLDHVRNVSTHDLEQRVKDRGTAVLAELQLHGWSTDVDRVLERSCLVLDLLTNRDTGGTIAGPDVHSDNDAVPRYAAVWGRDAAWTVLGALAMGCETQARKMLEFAFKTQSPVGLWLHRHHTDYTLASSRGLHQIDETGILLHAVACYTRHTGSDVLAEKNWTGIARAADFLVSFVDKGSWLPYSSVNLWEEREGVHLYTTTSLIAGLQAAVDLSRFMPDPQLSAVNRWTETADNVRTAALSHFWYADQRRFIVSAITNPTASMVDVGRSNPSISTSQVQPETGISQYPNWHDEKVVEKLYGHDVSVVSLAVPFDILPLNDERIISTTNQLRRTLWNKGGVGGLRRYEGDTLSGGKNPWPLATLWLAMYEGSRGNTQQARNLTEWVLSHTTPAGLVPEQIHHKSGEAVTIGPLSWSHAMLVLAITTSL